MAAAIVIVYRNLYVMIIIDTVVVFVIVAATVSWMPVLSFGLLASVCVCFHCLVIRYDAMAYQQHITLIHWARRPNTFT